MDVEYRIEIEKLDGQKIIHTSIKGLMTEERRNQIALQTIRKMREHNIHKVIWDIREAKLAYPLLGSHKVVLNLSALGVTSEDYIAVIYFHNKDQHEHARTVAMNRGIFNLAYFENLEEGISWLLDQG